MKIRLRTPNFTFHLSEPPEEFYLEINQIDQSWAIFAHAPGLIGSPVRFSQEFFPSEAEARAAWTTGFELSRITLTQNDWTDGLRELLRHPRREVVIDDEIIPWIGEADFMVCEIEAAPRLITRSLRGILCLGQKNPGNTFEPKVFNGAPAADLALDQLTVMRSHACAEGATHVAFMNTTPPPYESQAAWTYFKYLEVKRRHPSVNVC